MLFFKRHDEFENSITYDLPNEDEKKVIIKNFEEESITPSTDNHEEEKVETDASTILENKVSDSSEAVAEVKTPDTTEESSAEELEEDKEVSENDDFDNNVELSESEESTILVGSTQEASDEDTDEDNEGGVIVSILRIATPKDFVENTKNYSQKRKEAKESGQKIINIFDLSSLQGVAITAGIIGGIILTVKTIKKLVK